jgi:pyruvate,water dikinase
MFSFAGQYSSFLNIKGDQNILSAINLCYQSLFNKNAKVYSQKYGIDLSKESMAVAIQELIPPLVAGVLFTVNPTNNNLNEIVIEFTDGLGDSVVDGRKKPVTVYISKNNTDDIEKSFLQEVVTEALKLERVFGCPQDIEWGWDGKKIYIFQSRSITTLKNIPAFETYNYDETKIIAKGTVASCGISRGQLKVITSKEDYNKISDGSIVYVSNKIENSIIEKMPLIRGLIITGGVLSHMAVIAREYNIPCLVDPQKNNGEIKKFDGQSAVLDCSKGIIQLSS